MAMRNFPLKVIWRLILIPVNILFSGNIGKKFDQKTFLITNQYTITP